MGSLPIPSALPIPMNPIPSEIFSFLDDFSFDEEMICNCLEPREQTEEIMDTLWHAWSCTTVNCSYSFCKRMKERIAKTKGCMHNMFDAMDCEICQEMVYFLNLHSDGCEEVKCEVFGCKNNEKDEVGRMMVKTVVRKIKSQRQVLESNISQDFLIKCDLCADDTKTVQSSRL